MCLDLSVNQVVLNETRPGSRGDHDRELGAYWRVPRGWAAPTVSPRIAAKDR